MKIITKLTMRSLFLSLVLCFSITSWANTPKLLFYGYVVEGSFEVPDATKNKKENMTPTLSDVCVQVYVGDSIYKEVHNRNTGFYAIVLECGRDYEVAFTKMGYVSKRFKLCPTQIPASGIKKSFKLFTDVTLFQNDETINLDQYSSVPVAICSFNPSKKRMVWDMDYAQQAMDEFLKLKGRSNANDKAMLEEDDSLITRE